MKPALYTWCGIALVACVNGDPGSFAGGRSSTDAARSDAGRDHGPGDATARDRETPEAGPSGVVDATAIRDVGSRDGGIGPFFDSGKSSSDSGNSGPEAGGSEVDAGAIFADPAMLVCALVDGGPWSGTEDAGALAPEVDAEGGATPDDFFDRWLVPQNWERADQPVLSLGAAGSFDDGHLISPRIVEDCNGRSLWYSGATDTADRVYRLGVALEVDGRFHRVSGGPRFSFGDPMTWALTPAFPQESNGVARRRGVDMPVWFAAASPSYGIHRVTLHPDGVFSDISPEQISDAYAPSVIRANDGYRMWYVDVSSSPWQVRFAESTTGDDWSIYPDPVLVRDQSWEASNLFYPWVVQVEGGYIMWYGSYLRGVANSTAIGFAASTDGISWTKYPENPVFRPTADHAWETNYVGTQSVVQLSDGTWEMWYAGRTTETQSHKYFAISVAHWGGPASP